MEFDLDVTKSAQKNAEEYFARSKKLRKKAEGARKAAEELASRLGKLEKAPPKEKKFRVIRKREWYERFNWFFTSSGLLAIGGRSASQNEELNSHHFDAGDLFFHADIFGASVVILKSGESASREICEEAAQFSASFSKAWENAQTSVDVYSMRREQVTKSTNKGSLSSGSFLLKGEREWYKNMELKLCATMRNGIPMITPSATCEKLGVENCVFLSPGSIKKSDAAKAIARGIGSDEIDYIMQHLPAGGFSITLAEGGEKRHKHWPAAAKA